MNEIFVQRNQKFVDKGEEQKKFVVGAVVGKKIFFSRNLFVYQYGVVGEYGVDSVLDSRFCGRCFLIDK